MYSYAANGTLKKEDMADITDWTDQDNGTNAASTQETFDSKSCMKLDSGNAATNNRAKRLINIGTLGATTVYSLNLYLDLIGNYTDVDYFELAGYSLDKQLRVFFAANGLFVANNGGTAVSISTTAIVSDTWQEWSFVVNWAATSTSIYLNNVLLASGISSCGASGSNPTNGTTYLSQNGKTTSNCTTYIDWFYAGDGFDVPSVVVNISD